MPKYLFTLAAGLLLSATALAQSLTVNNLIKLTEAKPDSVAAYLQTKLFKLNFKSETRVKSFVYTKKAGMDDETLAKSEDVNESGERLNGVTYMYNNKQFTQSLSDGLKAAGFKLRERTNDEKRTLLVYINDKYEARVSTYNDITVYSSIAIARADKRM